MCGHLSVLPIDLELLPTFLGVDWRLTNLSIHENRLPVYTLCIFHVQLAVSDKKWIYRMRLNTGTGDCMKGNNLLHLSDSKWRRDSVATPSRIGVRVLILL